MSSPEKFPSHFEALKPTQDETILAHFTAEEQAEIVAKQKVLSSLAYFIGKDFEIPVELNEPGAGWHWNFQENKIRIDPKDLLEKPMDYLRFVICHEGGHRRMSRTEFIPLEEWKEPGFSFLMNAIEDPRDNNFVAENYPRFKEQMNVAYEHDMNIEKQAKEKAQEKLGFEPRFMQAGFEYIKQWFKESKGEELSVNPDLPAEVRQVVAKTLPAAQDSWWRYPSRQEADSSQELITEYAKASYEVNRRDIWPEFKRLMELDQEDQKMQELLQDLAGEKQESAPGLPEELSQELTSEEAQALEDALEGRAMKPINLDSLPETLKQKIKTYIDALPEKKKQELATKAAKTIQDFTADMNKEIGGKLADDPEKKAERGKEKPESVAPAEEKSPEDSPATDITRLPHEARRKMEQILEGDEAGAYQEALTKVAPLIDSLTADLRDVFIKRKMTKTAAGYRSGRKWHIPSRIREKIAGIPLVKTASRQLPEAASEEKDYALTLMIDCSGSMSSGGKIEETFTSAVLLAETLHNLDIKFEIVGFQDILLQFKSFEDDLDDNIRDRLNHLILEVHNTNPGGHNNSGDNDDGACLLEASRHLAAQSPRSKFLIVLSDGQPAMDSQRKSSGQLDRELRAAVAEITHNTDQKLIGLGLKSAAVAKYYENNLADVDTAEVAETLGELLREIVSRY